MSAPASPPGPLALPLLASAASSSQPYRWVVPGSKSITNRAFILAALAEGTTVLEGVLHSDDTQRMRECLHALGIACRDAGPSTVLVDGGPKRLRPPNAPLFVGNSGTTVRFVTALAALVPGRVELAGDQHMAKRPIAEQVAALRQLGISVECPTGCPPVVVQGKSRTAVSGSSGPATVRMRGETSSQYFSALMLSGGLWGQAMQIAVEGTLVSRPYVEMTRQMVRDFGGQIEVSADEQTFTVQAVPAYRARTYRIEPDASSASYPLAIAAALGRQVVVPGLGQHSLQGDVGFATVLGKMGCTVGGVTAGDTPTIAITGPAPGSLRGITVDMHHISDTSLTLAALAPLATGPTTITNIGNIRVKETDRLSALATELTRLGQAVETGSDWLRITPRPITPAVVQCYNDHRMAMSFAVLGLARPGVQIADPACVAKTYPGFWTDVAAFARTLGVRPPW